MDEFRREEYRKELMERYGDRMLEKYENSRHHSTKVCDNALQTSDKTQCVEENITDNKIDNKTENETLDTGTQQKEKNWDISLIMGIVAVVGLIVMFVIR